MKGPPGDTLLYFKPDGSVSCVYCGKPLVYENINENDPPVSLSCQPAFHVFCSAACFQQFAAYLRSRGLMRNNDAQCPACGQWISPDLIQQLQRRWERAPKAQKEELAGRSKEKRKRQTTGYAECGECKQVKETVTYTCGHVLCADCKLTLTEKLQAEKYEPKEEHDPNCMLCRKPEGWFAKAKNLATSDTGMSVLKGAGEYGYKYCCSDCAVF